MPRKAPIPCSEMTQLEQMPNIGPAIAGALRRIGIKQPGDLCGRDPFALFDQLCARDGRRHDPCVLDVFMAATDFADGKPARSWWEYTPRRKRELARREQTGSGTSQSTKVGRRALLAGGVLSLLATSRAAASLNRLRHRPGKEEALRFTLLTDLHYADKAPGGTRYYRETPRKLADAGQQIARFQPEFVVELGDVIDAAESVDQEKQYLATIHRQLAQLPGDNHYVLGNHCVYWLTKPEFLEAVGQPKSYYSFDTSQFHLVVLDACFRNDGEPYGRKNFQWTDANIPAAERTWLESDLRRNSKPTIVFVHQRLDVEGHYAVNNAPAVRRILEEAGNVLAVFQGHNHKNDYHEIGGIHYCTINAMVEGSGKENNAFANVIVDVEDGIHVDGFYRQNDYEWTGRAD